jgi:alpha-tubulin suppressor-like RCC1 family protein
LHARFALVLIVFVAVLSAGATAPATAHAAGFRSLSAGGAHACAIRVEDDTLACWGWDAFGQASPPAGRYASVFAGGYHSCATRLPDRSAVCWGYNHAYYERFLPAGATASIAMGVFFMCSLSENGGLICGDKSPTCDVCDDGVALSQTPPGSFRAVTAGFNHACAIRSGDDTLACWGDDTFGEASPPPGAFASVSSGYEFTCGIRLDRALLCWGAGAADERRPPPGSFTAVAAGASHACALRTDRSIACWGRDSAGDTASPPGSFSEVSAGYNFSCGIRVDGALACWGADGYGVTDPPAIDRTPPTVRCEASPAVLWPRNGKLVPVTVDMSVDDAGSGPGGFALLSAASDQADRATGSRRHAGDVQGWTSGTADVAGLLRAETSGDAIRHYTLRYRGFDRAGNASDCTTTVTVPANRGRA